MTSIEWNLSHRRRGACFFFVIRGKGRFPYRPSSNALLPRLDVHAECQEAAPRGWREGGDTDKRWKIKTKIKKNKGNNQNISISYYTAAVPAGYSLRKTCRGGAAAGGLFDKSRGLPARRPVFSTPTPIFGPVYHIDQRSTSKGGKRRKRTTKTHETNAFDGCFSRGGGREVRGPRVTRFRQAVVSKRFAGGN